MSATPREWPFQAWGAVPHNGGMTSPTRFIKRLVSEQAPREAVVRMDLATRIYSVTFYRHGVKQPELARATREEKEALLWAREFVGGGHEVQG